MALPHRAFWRNFVNKVSVGIVTRHRPGLLAVCLASIVPQARGLVGEIVIRDIGYGDPILAHPEILAPIQALRHEGVSVQLLLPEGAADKSLLAGRRALLDAAHCSCFVPADDDYLFGPGFFSLMVSALADGADMVMGSICDLTNGRGVEESDNRFFLLEHDEPYRAWGRNPEAKALPWSDALPRFVGSGVYMYRTAAAVEANIYGSGFDLGEDGAAIERMKRSGKRLMVHGAAVVFHMPLGRSNWYSAQDVKEAAWSSVIGREGE